MQLVLDENRRVKAAFNEAELAEYGYDVKWFEERKPFKEEIILDVFAAAAEKYGMKFSIDDCKLFIDTCLNSVIFSFSEESNIVYLDNDFIQDEEVVHGIHRLFNELPDEKINMGIMDVNEKKKRLEELRSESGKEIIREQFLYSEGV